MAVSFDLDLKQFNHSIQEYCLVVVVFDLDLKLGHSNQADRKKGIVAYQIGRAHV